MPRKTTKPTTETPEKGNGKMEQNTNIVPIQHDLPIEAQANIDAYLEATTAESAKFLKFAKGEWLAGVDDEEIEA